MTAIKTSKQLKAALTAALGYEPFFWVERLSRGYNITVGNYKFWTWAIGELSDQDRFDRVVAEVKAAAEQKKAQQAAAAAVATEASEVAETTDAANAVLSQPVSTKPIRRPYVREEERVYRVGTGPRTLEQLRRMPPASKLQFVYRPKRGIGRWQVLTKTFEHNRWKRRALIDMGPAGSFATRPELVETWLEQYAAAEVAV